MTSKNVIKIAGMVDNFVEVNLLQMRKIKTGVNEKNDAGNNLVFVLILQII